MERIEPSDSCASREFTCASRNTHWHLLKQILLRHRLEHALLRCLGHLARYEELVQNIVCLRVYERA